MMRSFTVDVQGPFNFGYTQKYFSRVPGEIVDCYEDNTYRRVFNLPHRRVLLTVKPIGISPYNKLRVIYDSLQPGEKKLVEQRVRRIFNLDLDLEAFYQFAANDALLSQVIKGLYGYRIPCFPTLFESLVCTILGQQVNVRFALDVKSRLVKKFGSKLNIDGKAYYGFPTPESLASVNAEELRTLRVSRQKTAYIRGVATLFLNQCIDEGTLVNMGDEEIVRRLMAIRGIGRWSAEYVMIRGLGKTSVIPAVGTGIRAAFAHFFGQETASEEEVRRLSQAWKAHKGLAAFYLRSAYYRAIS